MRQRMLRSTPSGLIGLGPENEIITAAIEKLRTQIAGKLDADVLFPELDTLMKRSHIGTLDVHHSRSDDCWNHDHIFHLTLLMEEMLPDGPDAGLPDAYLT
jgi:hypothetical protein